MAGLCQRNSSPFPPLSGIWLTQNSPQIGPQSPYTSLQKKQLNSFGTGWEGGPFHSLLLLPSGVSAPDWDCPPPRPFSSSRRSFLNSISLMSVTHMIYIISSFTKQMLLNDLPQTGWLSCTPPKYTVPKTTYLRKKEATCLTQSAPSLYCAATPHPETTAHWISIYQKKKGSHSPETGDQAKAKNRKPCVQNEQQTPLIFWHRQANRLKGA